MNVHTIGIDLGKTIFHLVGLDQPGNVVLKRRPSRSQLLRQLANTPTCLIGMEACCGAHHLGAALGHGWFCRVYKKGTAPANSP
jgi:transposase